MKAKKSKKNKEIYTIAGTGILVLVFFYFIAPNLGTEKFKNLDASKSDTSQTLVKSDIDLKNTEIKSADSTQSPVPEIPITHIPAPEAIKGVYMTSCIAGTPKLRANVVAMIDRKEINAIVIDIKDFSGKISFKTDDPSLDAYLSDRCTISDIKEFINSLHGKNIYVIGRITSFQDPYYAKLHAEVAVKRASDGGLWADRKGINYLDPGSQVVWDHLIAISKASYDVGFDELNFDYIRFPSDGNMRDIAFPVSLKRVKAEVIKEFFVYLHDHLKDTGVKTSADLFGMVTSNKDDLGIGQVLENAMPYFDYVDPMVYPSHFPPHWNGYLNPAVKPYEVIHDSMQRAYERVVTMGEDPQKLRPWLQDFNLGAIYTSQMVRTQIQATYDVKLTSWLMWDPSNKYTESAFLPKDGITQN